MHFYFLIAVVILFSKLKKMETKIWQRLKCIFQFDNAITIPLLFYLYFTFKPYLFYLILYRALIQSITYFFVLYMQGLNPSMCRFLNLYHKQDLVRTDTWRLHHSSKTRRSDSQMDQGRCQTSSHSGQQVWGVLRWYRRL